MRWKLIYTFPVQDGDGMAEKLEPGADGNSATTAAAVASVADMEEGEKGSVSNANSRHRHSDEVERPSAEILGRHVDTDIKLFHWWHGIRGGMALVLCR